MSTTVNDVQITAAEAESLTVNHPNFRFVGQRSVSGYPYVVFERPIHIKPTDAQREEYQRNKQIVEAHGGRMVQQEYEIGGLTPRFTVEDCKAMQAAVERDLPDWKVVTTWNGEGSLSYSVAIQRR